MKLLVIDGGGRGHSVVWKAAQFSAKKIWCAPGNAGIGQERMQNGELVQCVPLQTTDLAGLLQFALEKRPDLTLVGADDPLALGIVDLFQSHGLRIWGPNRRAARFEASKAYTQWFCERHRVPCAEGTFSRHEEDILAYAKRREWQCVVKADGLALGKGAHPCRTEAQVREAIVRVRALPGTSGDIIVVQEFLQEGRELSLHFFCDGMTTRLMPSSVDHKTIDEEGVGLMTGGMGTISPDPALSEEEYSEIADAIITPWLEGCAKEGIDFCGVLYPGVKLTADGPKLLEFNARFGDTEAQTHLVRLETDLVEIAQATLAGTLERVDIRWKPITSVCVVLASEGYPGDVSKTKGRVIIGLERAATFSNVKVFHAGTALNDQGEFVTAGGRVLGVTAWAETLAVARMQAYRATKAIRFEGGQHYRRDIGGEPLEM